MEKKGIQTQRGDRLRNVQAANAMYDYAKSVESEEVKQHMQNIEALQEELELADQLQPPQGKNRG